MPHAAITTDIIVGFPGETEADFDQTIAVVERARFASAFTFQYSPRPGTPAATMADQIPKAVVQERYERLVEVQEQISWDENKKLVGTAGRGAGQLVRGQEGRGQRSDLRPGPGRPAGARRAGRPRRSAPAMR